MRAAWSVLANFQNKFYIFLLSRARAWHKSTVGVELRVCLAKAAQQRTGSPSCFHSSKHKVYMRQQDKYSPEIDTGHIWAWMELKRFIITMLFSGMRSPLSLHFPWHKQPQFNLIWRGEMRWARKGRREKRIVGGERKREGGRKKKTPYKISLHFIMERHERLPCADISR